jgi:hypothetical protein
MADGVSATEPDMLVAAAVAAATARDGESGAQVSGRPGAE